MQGNRKYQGKSVKEEEGFNFKQYIEIVLKRKKLILLTWVTVFVLWAVYVVNFESTQKYEASTLIHFQNPNSISAVREQGTPAGMSRLNLLKTRSFLEKVVLDLHLSLRISTVNLKRNDVFRNFFVDAQSVPGIYTFKFSQGNRLNLYFNDTDEEIDGMLLYSGDVLGEHNVNNFRFELNNSYLKAQQLQDVRVRIVSLIDAVNRLEGIISYKTSRKSDLLTLTVIHRNPELAAEIANRVSDLLVEENMELRRGKTREVLQILEDQLTIAKKNLSESENNLRMFKEKYPWIGLSADANTSISSITQMEVQTQDVSQDIDKLNSLLSRVGTEEFLQKFVTYREILTFLSAKNVTTAPALSGEFQSLAATHNRLLSEYADSHPYVVENADKINSIGKKIEQVATELSRRLARENQSMMAQIQTQEARLRDMPTQEVELARLRRKMEIDERIYSTILVRYNEAGIANQVEVGDLSVIDRAVPPNEGGYMAFIGKKIAFGLILGLALGFGLAFVLELLDRTVTTPDEAERKLGITVIGSIPIIGGSEDVPKFISPEDKKRIDPKLVTMDYSPLPIGESYRSIRARLLFSNKNGKVNSILVSSLNPSEGKSLNAANLAITIAQQKLPTILIDGDMRRGVIHNSFACNKKPGLADFLFSNAEVNLTNIAKVIQKTHVPNLFLISSGLQVPNPSEILGSPRMGQMIELLKSKFGMIILDTPPLIATSDAFVAAPLLDTILFVVRAGKTNVDVLNRKLKDFEQFRDKISGVILNGISERVNKSQYNYTYYNY
jgi:succinoglycan biosynthesis transport protein ExoP